ncbi:GH39 family glycosyl hydrolase [Vibrio spartinae]|uniref:Beta-xylosidase n=1 Tax=Vibrio spartinae TaxID=1918945 RepID=A0A1N6MB46_9VIBR|nr:helix-turn-helix domain-containing protein [Vibrio spartinae]QMV13792.1 Beta-xylosidase [Vibrio spartinae]SIO96570.1 Beta-xylosidase [Vibrio spartinae]
MNDSDFLDFKVAVESNLCEKTSFHSEIELVYVIEGHCTITIGTEKFILAKDDLILINSNSYHSINTPNSSLLVKITIDYFKISKILEDNYLLFWCNSKVENNFRYNEIKKIINEIVLNLIEDSSKNKFKYYSLQCEFIQNLVDNFKVNTKNANSNITKEERRLSFMLNYVQMNYMHKITLSDISEKIYMSVSSLSRFFVKNTGVSFVVYLREVRLQKLITSLIYTDEPITRLSVDHGFSNPSIMNKVFIESYELTPSEYRKKFRNKTNNNLKKDLSLILPKPKEELKKILTSGYTYESSDDLIYVDGKKQVHHKECTTDIINVGSAYNLSLSDVQNHTLYIKKTLNNKYIRVWNIFSDRFMIKDDSHPNSVNFDNLTRVLDFCVKNDIFVFIDLGSRSETAKTGKDSSLYKTNETLVFNSRSEWTDFLSQFLKHILKRYGSSIVNKWVFEISFYLNDQVPYYIENYNKLEAWSYGYEVIKSNIPDCRVAGPGIIPSDNLISLEKEIKSIINTGCIPDIFTMMAFPYTDYKESEDIYSTRLVNQNFINEEVEIIRNILDKLEFVNELWLTEWSYSLSNRNWINDSCHRASYTIKNILSTYNNVDALGFWYASDLINVYYDSKFILDGGAGLITKNEISKPVFYALSFLTRLGKYLVNKSNNCIVTTNNGRSFHIILHNNIDLGPTSFIKDEGSYDITDIENLFEHNGNKNISIEIDNLVDGQKYLVHQKIVNQSEGSVLDKWKELNFDQELSLEEINYLKQVCIPKVIKSRSSVKSKKLSLTFSLGPHEIRYVNIRLDD